MNDFNSPTRLKKGSKVLLPFLSAAEILALINERETKKNILLNIFVFSINTEKNALDITNFFKNRETIPTYFQLLIEYNGHWFVVDGHMKNNHLYLLIVDPYLMDTTNERFISCLPLDSEETTTVFDPYAKIQKDATSCPYFAVKIAFGFSHRTEHWDELLSFSQGHRCKISYKNRGIDTQSVMRIDDEYIPPSLAFIFKNAQKSQEVPSLLEECIVNRTEITLKNKRKNNLVRIRYGESYITYNTGIWRVALKYLQCLSNIDNAMAEKYVEHINHLKNVLIPIPIEVIPVQEDVIIHKLGKIDGLGFIDILNWCGVNHVELCDNFVHISKEQIKIPSLINISSLKEKLNYLAQVSSLFQIHKSFPFEIADNFIEIDINATEVKHLKDIDLSIQNFKGDTPLHVFFEKIDWVHLETIFEVLIACKPTAQLISSMCLKNNVGESAIDYLEKRLREKVEIQSHSAKFFFEKIHKIIKSRSVIETGNVRRVFSKVIEIREINQDNRFKISNKLYIGDKDKNARNVGLAYKSIHRTNNTIHEKEEVDKNTHIVSPNDSHKKIKYLSLTSIFARAKIKQGQSYSFRDHESFMTRLKKVPALQFFYLSSTRLINNLFGKVLLDSNTSAALPKAINLSINER